VSGAPSRLARWWREGVPSGVKLVYLLLLANGLPAFVILMLAPGDTDDLFVWTVKPDASAQLLGVMYGNALLLVLLGLRQGSWRGARVTVVLVATFSVLATVVTLFHLDPFLKHPWYHLAYWLSMYLVLFVAAPTVLVMEQRRQPGRGAIGTPLPEAARWVAATAAGALGVLGVVLLASPGTVSDAWPWDLTPLVGRIFGVWIVSLAAAYACALWDGDWGRTRPIFVQGIPTGAALALLPALHGEADGPFALYFGLAALLAVGGVVAEAAQAAARRARTA
jgi:hypothetical protein